MSDAREFADLVGNLLGDQLGPVRRSQDVVEQQQKLMFEEIQKLNKRMAAVEKSQQPILTRSVNLVVGLVAVQAVGVAVLAVAIAIQ